MKRKAAKPKMKTMYAAVQAVYDGEDPEYSEVKIIGIYRSRKTAEAELDKTQLKFYKNVLDGEDFDPDEVEAEAEAMLEDDRDRSYNWFVQKVKVETGETA